ncbi:P1 family peptidase [Velocimicrobium porci]
MIQEIFITEIEHIKIGNAEDEKNATGCTVILADHGSPTGVDIRGGGPASRETALLNPTAANDGIHAILLSGGSAFGLDAAGGVMEFLEEKDIGFPVGITKVPIVSTSCLFDLTVANHKVRPDKAMGYKACEDAWNRSKHSPKEAILGLEGNHGAGTGATVGKFLGEKGMMKSGLGTFAVQLGDLKVGAIVAVNALGDVFDYKTNKKLAGLCNPETGEFLDSETAFYESYQNPKNLFTGNTTIGAIITNASFTKTEMTKIAQMAQNGYARSIRPIHTTADGDSIYAMSTGKINADLNLVGTLSSTVMAEAVKRAVLTATPAYGLKTASQMQKK